MPIAKLAISTLGKDAHAILKILRAIFESAMQIGKIQNYVKKIKKLKVYLYLVDKLSTF